MTNELVVNESRANGISDWSAYIGSGPESYDLGYSPDEPDPSYAHILINTSEFIYNNEMVEKLDEYCFNSFPNADIKVGLLGSGGGGTPIYGYRLRGDTSVSCGTVNGPILRFQQNKIYKLTLVNSASTETNLHVHGMHVIGSGDSDDPTRIVKAGECLDYVYDLKNVNHPPGTHWYHPHRKGNVGTQIKHGAAFGMIIVDDEVGSGPGDWATNKDTEKLVQISSIHGITKANMKPAGTEVINVDSNRWYRLRLSLVVPSGQGGRIDIDWMLYNSNHMCKMWRVASDGVWHVASFDTYGKSTWYLTGVSRADFMLRCGNSNTAFDERYNLNKVFTIQPSGGNTNVDGLSMNPLDPLLGTAPIRSDSINIPSKTVNELINSAQMKPSGIQTFDFENGEDYDYWPTDGRGNLFFNYIMEWTLYGWLLR